MPNPLLGKPHTTADPQNHFLKSGPHSRRAFENPSANLLYPGRYHFGACKINCFTLLGDSSSPVPPCSKSDFCFLRINTIIFLRSCCGRLQSASGRQRWPRRYCGEASLAAARGRGLRRREELGLGCSCASVGLARGHKPSRFSWEDS